MRYKKHKYIITKQEFVNALKQFEDDWAFQTILIDELFNMMPTAYKETVIKRLYKPYHRGRYYVLYWTGDHQIFFSRESLVDFLKKENPDASEEDIERFSLCRLKSFKDYVLDFGDL